MRNSTRLFNAGTVLKWAEDGLLWLGNKTETLLGIQNHSRDHLSTRREKIRQKNLRRIAKEQDALIALAEQKSQEKQLSSIEKMKERMQLLEKDSKEVSHELDLEL